MNVHALILAAGKGTRMPSKKPKVMQTLLNDTMLSCVYDALKPIFNDNIFTLVGYKKEFLLEELERISPIAKGKHIEQKELLGTGHALQMALPYFQNTNAEYILVVNGDVPLLSNKLIEKILCTVKEENADVLCTSIMVQEVGAYGRIVREDADLSKEILQIVEAKDYEISQHGLETGEINAGLYVFKTSFAEKFLPKLTNNNANNEYYITDLIALAIENNYKVSVYNAGYDSSLLGINNPYELFEAEEFLRKKRNAEFMKKGVILHNPATISISKDVEIQAGAEIFENCSISGKTCIEAHCTLESHCIIKNSHIKEETHISAFSHIEEALVEKACKVGPYARLRPKAHLCEEVHVGNFVEVKKSIIGKQSKANHLTYIGDAQIGEGTNIGAGTITCNYDGKNKHLTQIGDNCFIGSNTALVAPIQLENNVLIGAGSVITKPVPANTIAVARGKQVNLKRK